MQVPREISYEDLQKLMLKEMCQVVAERVLESAQTADIFRARIAEAHRPRDPAYLQPEVKTHRLPPKILYTGQPRSPGIRASGHLKIVYLIHNFSIDVTSADLTYCFNQYIVIVCL